MTDRNRIRKGSLQFYPRVRAKRIIPNANWKPLSKDKVGFLGFIGYKVGMVSVWAKDETADSLTKGKRIAIPATVIECPTMKIFSIRFYKNGLVTSEIVVAADKELKKRVKLSPGKKEFTESKNYDDVRVILYNSTKALAIDKSTPDLIEIALSGKKEEKIAFIKERIGKEIPIAEVFNKGLVDVRGVTKGFGTQGPVKRYGIGLKDHKSEKGLRRPGSLGPWHPARVTFRVSQAGQTGYHSRTINNNMILKIGKSSDASIIPSGGFPHYGLIKSDYLIVKGSIPGPQKRGVLLTAPLRPSKKTAKQNYEVLEIR